MAFSELHALVVCRGLWPVEKHRDGRVAIRWGQSSLRGFAQPQ